MNTMEKVEAIMQELRKRLKEEMAEVDRRFASTENLIETKNKDNESQITEIRIDVQLLNKRRV